MVRSTTWRADAGQSAALPVGKDHTPWITAAHPLYQHLDKLREPFVPVIAQLNDQLKASVHALAASQPEHDARLEFVDCGHVLTHGSNATTYANVPDGLMSTDMVHLMAPGYKKLGACIERPLHKLEGLRAHGVTQSRPVP